MPDVLPDPLECLRLFLRERPAVTALTGTRISVALDGSNVSIRLSEAGGASSYADGSPLILVECWGRGGGAVDDGKAGDLARIVAAEVESMRGSYAGGHVAGASMEGGISDSPDPVSKRPRKLLTIRLSTQPLEE